MAKEITQRIELLILQMNEGDSSAREELFHITYDRLARHARKQIGKKFVSLRNRDRTSSIVHETYLKMRRRWDFFVGNNKEEMRLTTSAQYFSRAALFMHDVLVDEIRKQQPEKELDDRAEKNERSTRWLDVHEKVGQLPEDLRIVTDLFWFHGCTHAEVGEQLGLTEEGARARWKRAKMELYAALQDYNEIP